MPRFVDEDRKILVSTSFKVMYSSIAKSGIAYLDEAAFASRIGQRRYSHVLLVRDPYTRLASFFADKLRKSVQSNLDKWQQCQKIFLPFVGATRHDPPQRVRDALLSISVERFVDLLPSLRDEHLQPQSALLNVKERQINCRTRVFRIESDVDRLWRLLRVSRPPHLNKTLVRPDLLTLARERLNIVNDLYREDFLLFGYGMH